MDFTELLEKRRSIRDFEDKPVSLETIKAIIAESIKAPNAGNRQQWKFIVVNNKAMMKRISDASKAVIMAGIEKDPNSPMKGYLETLKKEDFIVFYNAPCVVFLVGPAKNPTIAQDCGLLAAYFMLSAASKGLGTCWIAQGAEARDPELLKELNLPDGFRLWAPIILGYPKNIPPLPGRKDPDILKIIT
jgi:nitroreductase